MLNALTIEIDDRFHLELDRYEGQLMKNTMKILEILDKSEVMATFFPLGWIAERNPRLIQKIHSRGHEIACQGYAYKPICNYSKEAFREDVKKAKKILENIIGKTVIGYHAPAYSITQKSLWPFEVLIEEGFKYDCSIYPMRNSNSHNGIPGTKNFIYNFLYDISVNGCGSIKEFPIWAVRNFGNDFRPTGSGYLRPPYWFIKWQLKWINQKEKKPFTFCITPWEIDTEGLPINIHSVSGLSKLWCYLSLDKPKAKLKRLLGDFYFSTIQTLLGLPD